MKHSWLIPPALAGERLDKALARVATDAGHPLSRIKARALIDQGAVYLDGKRVRVTSRTVSPGGRLEATLDPAPAPAARFDLTPEHILFEDDTLIAVHKPPHLPTQATAENARDTLLAAVERFLARRDGRQPYVALHHRLDRDTTGVLLLAKHPDANAGLAAAFRERLAVKTYLAFTLPPPAHLHAWEAREALLTEPFRRGKRQTVHADGEEAHTSFVCLERAEQAALIQAQPHTGRMHQLRVHLAFYGAPLLGDPLYGGPIRLDDLPLPRVALHAAALALPHPLTGQPLILRAPLPDDLRDLAARLHLTPPEEPAPARDAPGDPR